MITIIIDIVNDILKSRIALHDFGQPVNKILMEKIKDITSPTTIVLDLRRVNPMDYEFVNISFKETIEMSQKNENLYLAFFVDSGEFDELCTGIIDILGLKMDDNSMEQEVLISNGFSMIYKNENNETKYLTSLSGKYLEVLALIENNGPVASADIQSKFDLNAEDTSDILEELKKSKFITQVDGPKYLSLKSFIN